MQIKYIEKTGEEQKSGYTFDFKHYAEYHHKHLMDYFSVFGIWKDIFLLRILTNKFVMKVVSHEQQIKKENK